MKTELRAHTSYNAVAEQLHPAISIFNLKGSLFMRGKRFSGEKSQKSGFYLALAICLVAVGIAAWSTYEAVQGYLTAEENPIAEDVRKNIDPEDGENIVKVTPKPTQKPESNSSGSAAASSQANEPQKADAPIKEETPVAENGPLYLISEVMTVPVSSEEVIKPYSKGTPVFSPTMKDWRIHTGTDFKAAAGESVTASGNGIVKDVYTDTLLGNVVSVEHGDYVFYYCGLGENAEVEVGEIVSAGQKIGEVTAVPSEAADDLHLHLEVKHDGVYVDPIEILDKFKGND